MREQGGGALRGRLDSLRRLLRSREGGDPAPGSEQDREDEPDPSLDAGPGPPRARDPGEDDAGEG